jgi:NDP-sugar pyrophosphorylase family protein
VNIVIVALDLPSLAAASGTAAAAGTVLAGVIARGWLPVAADLSAPLLADPPVADRREVRAFVAGGPALLNQARLAAMLELKAAGFRFAALASPLAGVAEGVRLRDNAHVEAGARVGAGADLGANVWIGEDSLIGHGALIGHSAWIGRDCRIGTGARIGRNCVLGDGVRLEPGCVLEPWTLLEAGRHVKASPGRTIFCSPLFRADVSLRGGAPGIVEAP